MKVALIDLPGHRQRLFPLTMTRPIADLRVGILTIKDKWEKHLQTDVSFLADQSLTVKFPLRNSSFDLFINGAVCPNRELIIAIEKLDSGQSLFSSDTFIAAKSNFTEPNNIDFANLIKKNYSGNITIISRTWDLFRNNASEIQQDFNLLTASRISAPIEDKHTIVYGKENIFLEEGATIKAAILNAENGPIYLGAGSEIHEGTMIRGPFALGEKSVVNMGAKIKDAVTIGPGCKIGGEVSNTIFWGHSNKAHDGFLGNALIGEWCNLGAGTNNSNLKNNYDIVKVWDYEEDRFISTGLQFCGLLMGDHSKSAINTMFNTGTVIGVCCNIFGSGFPRNFIPSFSWGGVPKSITHSFEKAMTTAKIVMARRGIEFTTADEKVLKNIFDESAKYRK